jgi:hypothetical protein
MTLAGSAGSFTRFVDRIAAAKSLAQVLSNPQYHPVSPLGNLSLVHSADVVLC